ncbi:MAG: hypothetical protein RIE08_09045 [Acidimicrobiales bacterium]
MAGDVIEFLADDGGPPVRLHNHDPARVARIIASGGRCEYASRWSLLRFVPRPDADGTTGSPAGRPHVSVTTRKLRPCLIHEEAESQRSLRGTEGTV